MNRLRIILLLSHIALILGCTWFYVEPGVSAAAVAMAGLFLRWMVPHRTKSEPRSFIKAMIIGFITHWLVGIGLLEFLQTAWVKRMSISPLLALGMIMIYVTVTDWLWFLGLSEDDLDRFYSKHPTAEIHSTSSR